MSLRAISVQFFRGLSCNEGELVLPFLNFTTRKFSFYTYIFISRSLTAENFDL